MRFCGQVAVVTGGALGIGGGISRRLAAAGAHVVLADINSDAASATHEEIVVAAVTKTALAVDDSRVDILVNNVGDFRPAARRAAHVPRRVARNGESWSRSDRQQRNR